MTVLVVNVQENTRYSNYSRGHSLHLAGMTEVCVSASGEADGDVTYYAVVAPLDRVLDLVCLADGGPIPLDRAKITARCYAVSLPGGAERGAWWNIPIRVQISLDGHKGLSFDWRLDDPPTERTLLLSD